MTEHQRFLLEQRKAGFDQFYRELMPVVVNFVTLLELPNPHLVLTDADSFLPGIEEWLRVQEIDSEDHTWLLTRLGYFTGELLVQRYGGCWIVSDSPDSRYFARYVVANFRRSTAPGAAVDPFEIAAACLAEPVGRSLSELLKAVEKELIQ